MPDSAKAALQMAKANGHKIFIATGRARVSIPEKVERLGFNGMITCAGAFVEYEGKPIAHRVMKSERLEELSNYLLYHQAVILYEGNDNCYAAGKTPEEIKRVLVKNIIGDEWAAGEFIKKIVPIHNMSEIPYVNKMVYFNADCDVEEVQNKWHELYNIVPNSVNEEDGYSGEISEYGINKASGIEALLTYLSASRNEVIAMGDGWNDLEMIQYAHTGVAMGNGVDELKEAADFITGDIKEDGLWQAFEQLKLLE